MTKYFKEPTHLFHCVAIKQETCIKETNKTKQESLISKVKHMFHFDCLQIYLNVIFSIASEILGQNFVYYLKKKQKQEKISMNLKYNFTKMCIKKNNQKKIQKQKN